MKITIHKFIILFILIIFLIGFFLIRNHINNSMLPERERKLTEKINNEIIFIKENYKNKLFIDSQQSSSYILQNFGDNIKFNISEELKLIYANSIAKIAVQSKNKNNIKNSLINYKQLIRSPLTNIKIQSLYSMAETIMNYPELELKDIDYSIILLEEALEFSTPENNINNNLASFLSTTLIKKYTILKSSNIKFKAIKLLEQNIKLNERQNNVDHIADSKTNLAILYSRIAKLEQGRTNLIKAIEIMEEVKLLITREYDPRKNAKIMRIIGDLYYLRSKLPINQNEAGNRHIQNVIKFRTKSDKAYKKAEQMGFFQDILPGVNKLKLEDAKKRKKNENHIIEDEKNNNPMSSNRDEEKK